MKHCKRWASACITVCGALLNANGAHCFSENNSCTNLLQTRTRSNVTRNVGVATGSSQSCAYCCNNGQEYAYCFDIEECAAGGPPTGKYAFVFSYVGKPPDKFLPHIQGAAQQTNGSSTFDLILMMTREDAKQLDVHQKQRIEQYKVQLKEVDWAVPPNMKFHPKENWCGGQDLVRLHALALDGYDAVAYYDTDIEFQGDVTPVFRCATRGAFLTTNGGLDEALNIGFFAAKPNPQLLQAAVAFAREANFSEESGWGESGWAPNNGYYVGGECGQGFFHHLFYKQSQKASQLAFAEAGIVPGSVVALQIERCIWNYQTDFDCWDFDCSKVRAHHKPNEPQGHDGECLKFGQQ